MGGARYPHRFHVAASQGCFVYAYIRREDSETAPAGTPYYIGIASNAGRPFRNRNRPVPPPLDRQYVRVVRRRLTWEQAGEWEKRLIAHYGLVHEGGILRNRNGGGAGTRQASTAVRQAAARRMKKLHKDPEFQANAERARRKPQTTKRKSDAAKAYYAQPGKRDEHAKQQKEVMNRPEVRKKLSDLHAAAFDKKLVERGLTREEYNQTPRGRNAEAVRRYRARLRLEKALEAEQSAA